MASPPTREASRAEASRPAPPMLGQGAFSKHGKATRSTMVIDQKEREHANFDDDGSGHHRDILELPYELAMTRTTPGALPHRAPSIIGALC